MLYPHIHSTAWPLTKIKPSATKPIPQAISAFTLGFLLATAANSQAQETVEEQKVTPRKTDAPTTRLKSVLITADTEASSSARLDYLNTENTSGALGDKTVLDTPFSITVIDSDEIVERGAKSIGQIFVNDASVYAPTPSFSTDWWGTEIRGLPVRNFYVDDVPMLLYWGGDFPTEAVESVSALKGLTGFMYGFGAPGGAISYDLKRPTKTPETSVNLGYRNPSLLSAHIDTSHNIGDEFAFRANLATEQGTAYNESKIDRTVASIALEKNFGESVNWFTSVVYEKNKIEAEPFQFYFSEYDTEASGGKLPDVSYYYDDFNINNSYYDTETLMASTDVKWQLNDHWALKYTIGFSRKDHKSNKSFAYLLNNTGDYEGYAYNFAGQLDNLFNQVMLQGVISTGTIEHEVVGGVGLQSTKDKWSPDFYWENDFNGNIHEEQTFRITRTPDFSLEPKPSNETSQTYAFASDTIHFNQHWQTIIGLRFTDYELKDLDNDPAEESGYSTKETSPTLALIYKSDEQTSLYGSYVEGLEPGSRIDSINYANGGATLDATVSEQYEIGVKHAAGKFNYTAAIFSIKRVNVIPVYREAPKPYLTQDGLETYKGVEFSTSYQLTDNLNLGLGAIYLDGSIENVAAESAALEGNDPAYAADVQLAGNFTYQLSSIEGLKIHGNVRYFGESYTSEENTLKLPDRTITNAGVSYEFKHWDRVWKLNGNMQNVLNEKYWSGGGFSSGNMGEARNISLSLNTMF